MSFIETIVNQHLSSVLFMYYTVALKRSWGSLLKLSPLVIRPVHAVIYSYL